MKERPILFSAPMVRAILDGTKTQTRRIMDPQPDFVQVHNWKGKTLYDGESRRWWWKTLDFENLIDEGIRDEARAELAKHSRYGVGGDRLWVRETWQAIRGDGDSDFHEAKKIPKERGSWSVAYAATDSEADAHREDRGFPWRPGIHMPRWASRITLDIVSVRVEQLHEIDELGALDEGVEGRTVESVLDGKRGEYVVGSARDGYRDLWNEINGNWDANPWVWVVEFKRVEAKS